MVQIKRRLFLKTSFSACLTALGMAISKLAHAKWFAEAFSSNSYDDITKRLFKNRNIIVSEQINLVLPQTAENGAVVPITISSNLSNIQRLYILVEKNPTPLAAEFNLSPELAVYLTARLKMAESCHVVVIAEQDGQLLSNRQWVNVVIGGCGPG